PTAQAAGAESEARCPDCHVGHAASFAGGRHVTLPGGCTSCHPDALAHQREPAKVAAVVDFSVELCGKCHPAHAESYLKDDGARPGRFGGSAPTSKHDEFPHYVHLMGGHGFAKDYKEERAHRFMLLDHVETKRRRNVVCLQCKSTPVAYYWDERRRGSYVFAKDMSWDDAVARVRERWPATAEYGASCSHCHDPHATGFRTIRKAMVAAILERGTDPYTPDLNVVPATAEALRRLLNERGDDGRLTPAARRLAGTLTCAQCHVEYTCGPGGDKDKGILRDDFPWRKAGDVEAYYSVKYAFLQDWTHSGAGVPGIKPQHPETEFYWGSTHHRAAVSCADCHMARGTATSNHWMTSPLKAPAAACGSCHGGVEGKVAEVTATQERLMTRAAEVERELDAALTEIEAARTAAGVEAPIEARRAFIRGLMFWEWTVVSENSAGWHNPTEAEENLRIAGNEARRARALLGAPTAAPPGGGRTAR
ncbi:MAG: ammonia-forming cytochrome c nitrite reductase subunit c552, partial [Myxococcota bacterium]|nr:ammonia-forming cytochrome c nitrite reductase subunit c552 [Myxococcota bacterium]